MIDRRSEKEQTKQAIRDLFWLIPLLAVIIVIGYCFGSY